jgi:predicted nucleic acid-binding protein
MKTVFADTFYWIALASPKDQWHERAQQIGSELGYPRIVTTEEVLSEFLTFLAEYGPVLRAAAVRLAHAIIDDPNISLLPQTRESFRGGLWLYEKRPDKGYSLVDCISMQTMRQRQLQEVLTHDHHFEQEGFTILLKD